MAMPIEDVKKPETLIEERGQIAAAIWTHVAGPGSDSGYSPSRRYLGVPKGRAEWYEQLDDRKKTKEACGEPIELKACAQDLLQQILKIDPTIADTESEDLLQRLWQGTHSFAIEVAKAA
jgi:hypothetical protein